MTPLFRIAMCVLALVVSAVAGCAVGMTSAFDVCDRARVEPARHTPATRHPGLIKEV